MSYNETALDKRCQRAENDINLLLAQVIWESSIEDRIDAQSG